jgi:hypothetical protein
MEKQPVKAMVRLRQRQQVMGLQKRPEKYLVSPMEQQKELG